MGAPRRRLGRRLAGDVQDQPPDRCQPLPRRDPPFEGERALAGIVNIGAKGALAASAGMGAYAASKAGVLKLTEALAEELKDDGVRVNAVLPSIIDTPANRKDIPKADFSRWVAPADLAAVIVFLLSDAARAITGAEIIVSGRT